MTQLVVTENSKALQDEPETEHLHYPSRLQLLWFGCIYEKRDMPVGTLAVGSNTDQKTAFPLGQRSEVDFSLHSRQSNSNAPILQQQGAQAHRTVSP